MAVTYCVALPFIRIADHSGADGLLRLVLDAAEKHRGRETVDLGFQKCVGDQCNSQGRDGVAPANCESFLHLIFDRIGGGRGRVRAGGF